MRFTCLVLLIFLTNVNAGNVWLKDIVSPKGWDLGHGVSLKLNENHKGKHIPATDRLSLDLNLGGLFGVSVGKAKSEGIELDFYVQKNVTQEGRGKKGGDRFVIPMMIGYKAALVISVIFTVMKMLTLKAIFLAKLSLIISFVGLLIRLKNNPPTEIIEFEQHGLPSHPPYFSGKEQGGGGYYGYGGAYSGGYGGSVEHFNYGKEAQASNIYQEIAYAPTAAGMIGTDSNALFSGASPNESVVAASRKEKDIQRRENGLFKDIKKSPGNMLFIKKYASIKAENSSLSLITCLGATNFI